MSGDLRIKQASAADVQAVGRLADCVFRPELQPGQGALAEFPRLFSADNASGLYFIEADGQPVSLTWL